jgi:SAM-dependent methyltransferase
MHYRIDFECRDDEPLQRTLNELYEYGDDVGTKILHRCRLNLFSLLLDDLIRGGVVTRFESALDVGCNAGMYSGILADRGFRHVLGVDVVPEMIDKARSHFARNGDAQRVEFQLAQAESLDLTKSYDFILCTEVIEHTDDPPRVISNLRRLIGPGGVAVISMPNRLSLPYLTAWLAYKLRRKPRDADFERHLDYPSFRVLHLFDGGDRRVMRTDGTNLFWDDRLIRLCYRRPAFASLNRVNFALARAWPLRYFAQFFYVVIRREP